MEEEQMKSLFAAASPVANKLRDSLDVDVLFYSGNLNWESSHGVIKLCRSRKTKKSNVLLILVSSGGDPTSGYRIARCLQQRYTNFLVYVPGWCKSAATLIAAGAHHIYIGDDGELGPLDIQISRKDEVWSRKSGLVVDTSVRALESTAQRMFFRYLYEIKDQNSSVTYKTAASIAVELVGKLLAPVYAQIDPGEIGENSRTMNITTQYAKRLDQHARNFQSPEWLTYLVESYPDHGFAIDRKEAKDIFTHVSEPTAEMEELAAALASLASEPVDVSEAELWETRFLSDELVAKLSVVDSTAGSPGAA